MTFKSGAMSVSRVSNLFLRVNLNREMDDQLQHLTSRCGSEMGVDDLHIVAPFVLGSHAANSGSPPSGPRNP